MDAHVKNYSSWMDYVIQSTDRERLVRNAVTTQKFDKYLTACELAAKVFPTGQGEITIDNPQAPYRYHCVVIDAVDTEFDDERLWDFAKLLGMFDGLSFSGADTLRIILQMTDLYIPG